MRRLPGDLLRVFEVALVTLISLIVYLVARLGTLLFFWKRARRRAAVARLRGKVLRRALATLGATYIKMGQVMSTRPDLLPPETIDELRKLQDRLPAFAFAKVRRIIEQDLRGPLAQHFQEIDERPVAAASIAQVHRARLLDGTEVAVKVLRPNVRRRIERDGRLMIFLSRLLAISPAVRLSDPVGHAKQFIAGILGQADLRNEAAHYARFYTNFAGVPKISFPRVFPAHSAERVLTMTFIRGRKIDALGQADAELARLTRTAFFKMCFQDGFVHADLHPGNMLITGDGELVIFDVGLVKDLEHDFMLQLVDFSRCVAMGTSKDFVNHLRRFHKYMDNVDWPAIERDAEGFVSQFRNRSVAELEMGAFIREVFALARRHQIRPIPEMVLVLVGVVTAEGISKMLAPDVNTFHEMASYLLPLIAKFGLDQQPLEAWIREADAIFAARADAAIEAPAIPSRGA